MKIDTKYAVMYIVSTQLLRAAYCVSVIILNDVEPGQECSQRTHWSEIFLALSHIPQPIFYLKFWHKKFKQFNDRAKVSQELSLAVMVYLIHAAFRLLFRIVLVLFNIRIAPHLITRVLEFSMVTFMNSLLVITVALPLRWQHKYDKERRNIHGVPLPQLLRNPWH
eukprot:883791_1